MKRLSRNLKRILSALAYEDAGEYMPLKRKKAFLGNGTGHVPTHTPVYSSIKASHTHKGKPQTAVIFDGHASDQVMSYLLHTPYIFNTEIIILAHGKDEQLEQKTSELSQKLVKAGRNNTVTYLLEDMADAFQEFCNENPDLQFLVAPKDDMFAREIIENPEFHSHSHEIPLILIQDVDRKPEETVNSV